jgi:uncharacterized cupin superfamily protein
MRRLNLFTAPVQDDEPDPEGFRAGMNRFGPSIGASMIGGSIYELPPGQSNCPYHYEYGNEEWLIVLSGRVTVRHPEGHEDLDAGDVVCFPEGPAGAHRLTNHGDETARLLMVSTMIEPNAAVYPDSDKIGVWPGGDADKIMVRRSSAVDYYDGER